MSPEDPTVDEATAAPPAESLQATQQVAEEESGSSEAEAGEPEQASLSPAEAYRQALDRYLAGDLVSALQIVDEVLSSGEETELRPRLERLRRRAEDRITREGGTVESAAEAKPDEAGGGQLIQAPSKTDEAQPDEAEAKPDEAEAKPDEAEAEAKPEAETKPEAEAKPDEAEAKPEAETKPDEAKPEADEAKPEADEAKPEAEAKSEAESKPEAEAKSEAEADAARKRGGDSGRHQAARPGGKRRPPGPPPARGARPRRPSGPPPISAALRVELDKIGGNLESLSKSVRGVENHTLKVAEAYQRISQHHKRKEQAYDQLYEELRQYKENFLLQAQKPLFKDIVLLFDGVNRSHKTVEEGDEEQLDKAKVLEMLAHIRDEILEVLYRRDIEPIEEHPDVLDIEFQKPVRRIETDDPEKDRHIAQVIREGFRMDGALLRPQEVVVMRHTKTDERES